MNILFLTIGKFDCINEKGIYTDLLREFKKNGHNLYVITPREKRSNLSTEFKQEDGVNFLRVRTGNITKTNLIEKGLSTLFIEQVFLKEFKKNFRNVKFDLILYSTPPITFEKIIKYIKTKDEARSYLLLKDIFPQNAVDLEMFSKKNLFYWFFRNKEKNLYKNSDHIGCMSDANVQFILDHNPEIPEAKVEICPNSIELIEFETNVEEIDEIGAKYKIPSDKITFVYGGSLGKPQGIDFLIECLKKNVCNTEVYFLIIGSGLEFSKLKSYFDSEKPVNAKLLSQLPKEEYEKLINSCDVGLIFLDKRFTIPNFPSRLLSYMQASIPVLMATDRSTDIGKIAEKGDFGYWCESGDIEGFNKNIQLLCNKERRGRMGNNARAYLEEHYTVEKTYTTIMKHFQ